MHIHVFWYIGDPVFSECGKLPGSPIKYVLI